MPREVIVFPGSSKAFVAIEVGREGGRVTVRKADGTTVTVWADQVRQTGR